MVIPEVEEQLRQLNVENIVLMGIEVLNKTPSLLTVPKSSNLEKISQIFMLQYTIKSSSLCLFKQAMMKKIPFYLCLMLAWYCQSILSFLLLTKQ